MTPSEQMDILKAAARPPFSRRMSAPLSAGSIEILQMNTGRRCNLACRHCHVSAGPTRNEVMGLTVFEKCLEVLEAHPIGTIDITGGAPEMNPDLPWFIRTASRLGRRLVVRTNLAILLDDEYINFIDLYSWAGVELVASLPDFRKERTDRQRGSGVFEKTVQAMRLLNGAGYGKPGSGLVLNLVHNPVGTYLPGSQQSLEHEYRIRLESSYGISFNSLFCLSNSPVGRFLDYLVSTDNLEDYLHSLSLSFNYSTIKNLMCRNTVSVGWDGALYDCDFNQALDLRVDTSVPGSIFHFDFNKMKDRRIAVGNHCYSCTAGAGSSCRGSIQNGLMQRGAG